MYNLYVKSGMTYVGLHYFTHSNLYGSKYWPSQLCVHVALLLDLVQVFKHSFPLVLENCTVSPEQVSIH